MCLVQRKELKKSSIGPKKLPISVLHTNWRRYSVNQILIKTEIMNGGRFSPGHSFLSQLLLQFPNVKIIQSAVFETKQIVPMKLYRVGFYLSIII
jgi:hypothetical protein